MKRLIATILALAACGTFVLFAVGAGSQEEKGSDYYVELDNAFGLIEGADVKISGVRAGKVAEMLLDDSTAKYYAKIGMDINKEGFGDLRTDVRCETRPQSLIGEYFVDCDPGQDRTRLAKGSTIPVQQTASTIPVDLVNNIMRRPYRERFSILLSELGVALAARGEDLNETIRRANPALREVDRVLALLRDQRKTISNLYKDADVVIGELADKRKDVTRFVTEARDTAQASAERRGDLATQFRLLPDFLAELQPTMRLLGEAADQQRPALKNLSDNAPLLVKFLDLLGPFSEASRPAFRTLADAATIGRKAFKVARPNIADLRKTVLDLPEVANNLAITLEHLDDPKFATEKDTRNERGGYTGLEAFLRYLLNTSQTTNLVDANGYLLKVSPFLDNLCAGYTNAEMAKEKSRDRCAAILGPNRPGINSPDPTKTTAPESNPAPTTPTQVGPRAAKNRASSAAPAEAAPPQTVPAPASPAPGTANPGIGGDGGLDATDRALLDFLLSP